MALKMSSDIILLYFYYYYYYYHEGTFVPLLIEDVFGGEDIAPAVFISTLRGDSSPVEIPYYSLYNRICRAMSSYGRCDGKMTCTSR
jgi:hypothetical protein